MPEVSISIGGRDYAVACQDGEEQYLHSAARLLDTEASAISGQAGRLPETRMLLMAGLMLADKTAGLEEQLQAAESRMSAQEAELEQLRNGGAVTAQAAKPEKVEIPTIPEGLGDELSSLAARAEEIAAQVEAKSDAA